MKLSAILKRVGWATSTRHAARMLVDGVWVDHTFVHDDVERDVENWWGVVLHYGKRKWIKLVAPFRFETGECAHEDPGRGDCDCPITPVD